jgi:Rrf2 family iron-sulfur cluster assembly transcriptional regulator
MAEKSWLAGADARWRESVAMELNTKGRYAVMAMADLAKQGTAVATPLPAIAERQQISIAYLEQIFIRLRRAGLVESARGRAGGYKLGRPANAIVISEIMSAVEEDTRMTRCHGEGGMPCVGGRRCLTHGLWEALGAQIAGFLSGVTLQDVLDGLPASQRWPVAPAPRAAAPPSIDTGRTE